MTASGAITAAADELRTGWYPDQPRLDPTTVAGPTFGRLWRTALSLSPGEQVLAQPLVVGGTVFVVTESNNLYSVAIGSCGPQSAHIEGSPPRCGSIASGRLGLSHAGARLDDSAS